MLKIAVIAVLVACTYAEPLKVQGRLVSIGHRRGSVPIALCEGEVQQGVAIDLRISNCVTGVPCVVHPGEEVVVEGDFIPAINCANAHFRGVAVVAGIPIPIAEGDLGALAAGTAYTVTQEISISEALVGLRPKIRIDVTEAGQRIVCVETDIEIARP